MTNYSIRINVQEDELREIMNDLQQAQEQIYRCYNRLQSLGVVTISKEKEPSAETDGR